MNNYFEKSAVCKATFYLQENNFILGVSMHELWNNPTHTFYHLCHKIFQIKSGMRTLPCNKSTMNKKCWISWNPMVIVLFHKNEKMVRKIMKRLIKQLQMQDKREWSINYFFIQKQILPIKKNQPLSICIVHKILRIQICKVFFWNMCIKDTNKEKNIFPATTIYQHLKVFFILIKYCFYIWMSIYLCLKYI